MSEQTKPTTEAGTLTISIPDELKDFPRPPWRGPIYDETNTKFAPHTIWVKPVAGGEIAALVAFRDPNNGKFLLGQHGLEYMLAGERDGHKLRTYVVITDHQGTTVIKAARAVEVRKRIGDTKPHGTWHGVEVQIEMTPGSQPVDDEPFDLGREMTPEEIRQADIEEIRQADFWWGKVIKSRQAKARKLMAVMLEPLSKEAEEYGAESVNLHAIEDTVRAYSRLACHPQHVVGCLKLLIERVLTDNGYSRDHEFKQ